MEMMMEMKAEREIDAAVEMVSLEATMERMAAEAEMLEQRLAAVEAELAELRAGATANIPAVVTNGRKTLPVAMANLLAKQGLQVDSVEPAALDAALASLSVEQRIAVKSQLLRAGLVG
jgi:hypothetical protein